MPLPVFAVQVRTTNKQEPSYRFVRALSPEDAAARAKAWEVPVVGVVLQPLTPEQRLEIGRDPGSFTPTPSYATDEAVPRHPAR